MTVLVTGGAGYVGSHAAYALMDAGEEVVVLDDFSTSRREWVPVGARCVAVGSLRRALRQACREYEVDAIMHFAGSVVVADSVADPLHYYHNNTVQTRELIEVAVENRIRVVFSSSAAVYGNQPRAGEAVAPSPESPYGSSKLMSEWMLRDCREAYGLQYAALRYFNVAGADPEGRTGQSSPRATHLIKVACQKALSGEELEVYGNTYPTPDGTCVRDYVHVSDVARAHVDALRHLRRGGESGPYNVGYGRGHSVMEVVRAVERASGGPLNWSVAPPRLGDPAVLVADADKIKKVMGWAPRHQDIDEIVEGALRWEKALTRRPGTV
jgi:UDP-glucose 4-epimerase